jgi:hypothetical protein
LNGRYYWNKRTLPDLETALSYFNQVIAKDPGYALAYSGLADTYVVMSGNVGSFSEDIPKSNAAARRALELDATLARQFMRTSARSDSSGTGFLLASVLISVS